MIEKILDKYYAKKLEFMIRNSLALYFINKKFIYTKHLLELYIKLPKWQESYYTLVMVIPYTECFGVIIDKDRYNDLIEDLKLAIKEKYKEE